MNGAGAASQSGRSPMASIRPMQCDSVPDSSLRDRPPAPEGELNGSGLAISDRSLGDLP